MSPIQVLEQAFIGKKIKSFEYGNDGERTDFIGKVITKVSFGWNDCREDAGLLIYVDFDGYSSDGLFVYDLESIEFWD